MTRNGFLSVAGATFAVGAAGVPASAGATVFDPHVTGISRDAVLAVVRARNAAHRQLFVSSRPNGNVWIYVRNSLNGYQFGWNEGARSLYPIVLLNGFGVAQAVDDASWQRYGITQVLTNAGMPPQAGHAGNPWLAPQRPPAQDDHDIAAPFNQDVSIQTLQRRGVDIFVCDTAMGALSLAIAGTNGDPNAVHSELRNHLVTGAFLVPSGASTIDTLQAERFTLYDANV